MKILSVDDDPIILELLTAVLASIGETDVTTAESAAEALQLIKDDDTPFDCFLLDIQMPKIDGIQLCKALRMMPEYHRTPILMITAMSDKSYIDKAFEAGATDYVTKPFDVLELGTRVRIAESLVIAWQQKADFVEHNFQGQSGSTEKPYALQDALPIDDVDGVIDYVALENYVSQLSRSRLFGSAVLAFSIAEIETLFDTTTAFEFESLITDVAEAVTISLQGSQALVSYAGDGTFVCIIDSGNRANPRFFEQEIRDIIASMELCYNNGQSLHFMIGVGDYVRLTFRTGKDVIKALSKAKNSARFRSEDLLPAKPVMPFGDFMEKFAG